MKRTVRFAALMVCLLLCVGCTAGCQLVTKTALEIDDYSEVMDRAQEITVTDKDSGQVLVQLANNEEIKEFIRRLEPDRWSLSREKGTPALEVTFSKQAAQRLGQEKDPTLYPICTLGVEAAAPRVTLTLSNFNLSFTIPDSAHDYLLGLAA